MSLIFNVSLPYRRGAFPAMYPRRMGLINQSEIEAAGKAPPGRG